MKLKLFILFIALSQSTQLLADFETGYKAWKKNDYKTAMREFKAAVNNGTDKNNEAPYFIALMYRDGLGVLEDDRRAAQWFLYGAKNGDPRSHSYLGSMYYSGSGVSRDLVRAYMWWNIGAYLGSKMAEANKHSVSSEMSKSQIRKAQEMSQICLSSKYTNC
jgi:TPR repeat protein